MAIIKTEIKQKTIEKEVTLTGVGLHTGADVKLVFKPGAENSGFVFQRKDLEGCPKIEADANYVLVHNVVHVWRRMELPFKLASMF